MKIGVVIPIVNDVFINQLLDCIAHNTVIPDSIIIVNNSKNDAILMETHLPIYRTSQNPMSVNASWTYGIKELLDNVDLISILNDDLLIEKWFFEKLIRVASKCKNAAVICPETTKHSNNAFLNNSVHYYEMSKREGWAWTIRSDVARIIPFIPNSLKTFCGDDWYWHHCRKLGRPWIKMVGCLCYHYIGQSVSIMNVRQDLRTEIRCLNSLL